MPSAVELHDSNLAAVTRDGSSAIVLFSPAYVHRWDGKIGDETSTGWLQVTTFAFSEASVSAVASLPSAAWGGSLRIGNVVHDNLIPSEGSFDTPCELQLTLVNSEAVVVRGSSLRITPRGEPSYLEKFRR